MAVNASTSREINSQTETILNENPALSNVQAQFEVAVELRRFINIDLFQRGYYQIRLSLKCANKLIPSKVSVKLEKTTNNNNLSEVMFPR